MVTLEQYLELQVGKGKGCSRVEALLDLHNRSCSLQGQKHSLHSVGGHEMLKHTTHTVTKTHTHTPLSTPPIPCTALTIGGQFKEVLSKLNGSSIREGQLKVSLTFPTT